MKSLPAAGAVSQIDDDQTVPEELVGRLYRATEQSVLDMLPDLSVEDRAYLAMYCYRKSHLHRVGLAIAKTCDEVALVRTWGNALGLALYAQSREPAAEELRAPGPQRPKVTLASLTGHPFAALHQDDDVDDLPEEITVSLS